MLCVLLLCGSKRMGEPDPPLPRLLLLPPQPPTPVKSGVDVMIMSAPRWGFKELTRFWPELWVKGYPLGLGGGGVDALDEEFTGEGSPWISVEAPVVAIIRGHNWAQSLFQLVINISSMNLFTNLRIMITIWSKPVFGTFYFEFIVQDDRALPYSGRRPKKQFWIYFYENPVIIKYQIKRIKHMYYVNKLLNWYQHKNFNAIIQNNYVSCF